MKLANEYRTRAEAAQLADILGVTLERNDEEHYRGNVAAAREDALRLFPTLREAMVERPGESGSVADIEARADKPPGGAAYAELEAKAEDAAANEPDIPYSEKIILAAMVHPDLFAAAAREERG